MVRYMYSYHHLTGQGREIGLSPVFLLLTFAYKCIFFVELISPILLLFGAAIIIFFACIGGFAEAIGKG